MTSPRPAATAAQSGPAPSQRPAESGNGESAGAWQDISAAPRDGTRFLVAAPDIVMIGHWSQRLRSFTIDATHLGWLRDKITHWMPLPEPPVDARGSGAESRSAPSIRPASAEADAPDDGGKTGAE